MMKQCSRCRETKPTSEFHKDKGRSDGLSGWCKPCRIKSIRIAEAKRPKPPYTPRSRQPERIRERTKKRNYRAAHPERVKAALKVQRALQSGKLAPATESFCFVCGNPAQHLHHMDYSKPLEVIPVCKSCHSQWHVYNKVGDRS